MKRGEVYYISLGNFAEQGSEQRAGRPAVIVSNNKCNETSDVVEVVYLTTQDKPDLPTHVAIRATGRVSTVLCEQICSVSKSRIGVYAGECTDVEMERIDLALMESLALDYNYYHDACDPCEESDEEEYNEPEPTGEIAMTMSADDIRELIRMEAERDTYKKLYESLFEKMLRN